MGGGDGKEKGARQGGKGHPSVSNGRARRFGKAYRKVIVTLVAIKAGEGVGRQKKGGKR